MLVACKYNYMSDSVIEVPRKSLVCYMYIYLSTYLSCCAYTPYHHKISTGTMKYICLHLNLAHSF